MEPLKKVQVEGYLMYAEPLELFGNIDELCYVSYTFCKEFILLLLKDCSDNDFGRTEVVGKALQRVGDTIICDYDNINLHYPRYRCMNTCFSI